MQPKTNSRLRLESICKTYKLNALACAAATDRISLLGFRRPVVHENDPAITAYVNGKKPAKFPLSGWSRKPGSAMSCGPRAAARCNDHHAEEGGIGSADMPLDWLPDEEARTRMLKWATSHGSRVRCLT